MYSIISSMHGLIIQAWRSDVRLTAWSIEVCIYLSPDTSSSVSSLQNTLPAKPYSRVLLWGSPFESY